MNYFERYEIPLSRLSFRSSGRMHSSKHAILHWNPDTGFHLEAALEKCDIHTSVIDAALHVSLGRTIKFSPRYLDGHWIAPNANPTNRFDCGPLGTDWLSLNLDRVLWVEYRPRDSATTWYGNTLLRVKGVSLPDRVDEQITLGGKPYSHRRLWNGLQIDEPGSHSIFGRMIDKQHLELSWILDQRRWSRLECWRFGDSLCNALAMISGFEVQVLQRRAVLGDFEWHEMKTSKAPATLGPWSLLNMDGDIDKEMLVSLATFFTKDRRLGRAFGVFLRRMFVVAGQQNREAAQLLLGTLLEGLLRTIDNHPARPGDYSWKIRRSMQSFQLRYLSCAWTSSCENVLASYDRLRNRNAHPDWLFQSTTRSLHESILQASSDMQLLGAFYGYMILAVAGVPGLKPKFPGPVRSDDLEREQ